MSDFLYIDPPPLDYGSMSVQDIDKGFLMDCTANMTARSDTIISVAAPQIMRTDGQTINSADITVSNVSVLTGGLKFGWTITGNGNTSTYIVNFPLTLNSGSVIWRAIKIKVFPAIG